MEFRQPTRRVRISVLLTACLVIFSSSTGSAQTSDQKFSLMLISGTSDESISKAKELIERAKALPDCRSVDWTKSSRVDRLIGFYDARLAGRTDGEKTILPIVNEISAQQSIAFYKSKNSKLKTDELITISNYLPWNSEDLPKNVNFYRSFADPINCSTFSSMVSDEPWLLAFTESLREQTGPIRYLASTKLKTDKSDQIATLLVVGFDKVDLTAVNIDLPDSPQPLKKLVLGATTLILLFESDRKDGATRYLSKWIDNLGQESKNSKVNRR